ncbi:putative leucine-rich repeat-containing protein DDB_G0290503 [Haliotis cracherodii]|uniref:putative leucine-rich repeat-containing protein DDB_G0290503 n=1 Tax=Haliotis cracherodii TaxID=6455 RepID=UPI0039EAF538
MAMNYVGSISIMDRGDAPAQAVMDRNARSLAQRVADETRDELEKVLSRVENIYGSFEMSGEYGYDTNMEYVNDIGELEELIRDQVKKRKYQQQVTIFIVGFQDVSGQKLRLLQQVNEFFMENSKSYEEEDWFPGTPDIDLEDVADKIDDSLKTANDLTKRLGELNKEIVDCLAAYAEKKATNKQVNLQGGEVKGRKKLEKALQSTRDEVANLSEKLLSIQTEIEEKDEKMQALFKQLEVKNLELQRFKTAAEVAKKNVQDSERLQAEIAARDETIKELRQKVNHLEIEVTSSNHTQEVSQSKLATVAEENQHRITQLTQEVEDRKIAIDEAKRDLQKVHESQVNALQETHRTEIDDLKKQHADEVKQLVEELERTQHELIAAQHRAAQLQSEKGDRESTDTTRIFDLDPSEPPSQDTTRQSTREGSRQSEKSKGKTKSKSKTGETRSKASRQGSVASKKSGKSPSRGSKSESKPGSRASIKADDHKDDVDDEIVDITQYTPADAKEYAEAAVQDEGGNPSTASVEKTVAKGRRSKTGLAPVRETDAAEYDNAFDLSDDASWAAVPSDQVSGRFTQYRKLCQRRVAELEEQLQLTQAKTQRKVSTLKAQFQEHKAKWEAERKLLFEQVSQAHKLQTEAEKEADAAMTQLEDFINEQEKLELDEESKRQGILGKTDTVAMEAKATAAKQQGESTTDGAMAAQPARSEDTEHDLRTLLQQTDDAKVQELNSRMTTSGAMSAPPAVEDDEVEPADKIPLKLDTKEPAPRTKQVGLENHLQELVHPLGLSLKHQLSTVEELFDHMYSEQTLGSDKTERMKGVPDIVVNSAFHSKHMAPSLYNQDSLTVPKLNLPNASSGSSKYFGQNMLGNMLEKMSDSKLRICRIPSEVVQKTSKGVPITGVQVIVTPVTQMLHSVRAKEVVTDMMNEDTIDGQTGSLVSDEKKVVESDCDGSRQHHATGSGNLEEKKTDSLDHENLQNVKTTDAKIVDEDSRNLIGHDHHTDTDINERDSSENKHEGKKSDENDVIDATVKELEESDQIDPSNHHQYPDTGRQQYQSEIILIDGFPYIVQRRHSPEDKKDESVKNMNYYDSGIDATDVDNSSSTLDIADDKSQDLSPKSSWSELEANRGFSSILESQHTKSLPPSQQITVKNLKKMMTQASVVDKQDKLLEMVRVFVQSFTAGQDLTDDQKVRTSTLVALATLMVMEENELGLSSGKVLGMFGRLMSEDLDALVAGFRDELDCEEEAASLSDLYGDESPGKVDVTAEENIRASSARSRASLRNQFRQKLVETKKVVDERRTKSPGMMLPTPRSMEEDTLHLDDEDDVTLPDDLKEEYRHKTLDIGTSPPPGMKRDDTLVSITDARQTPSLWDHPVVQDFLQVYEGVVQFKDQLGKILMDKELMSASQILSDLDVLRLDKSVKIQPQINNMAHNIYFMLEEIGNLLNNILVYDRDPPVSSLNISRDPTKGTLTHEETMDSVQHAFPSTRGSQRSQSSDQKTSSSVRELQEQYERLNEQFEEESKKHEEQLRHNTVVMMEMQDTINDLQRELSTLGKTAKRSRSATPVLQQRLQQIPSPETSVMFTRLDSERNAKIMKKAVLDDRLGPERYKDAVGQMNQYVSLPAQRLAHLARKYIHHCCMKAIEENVKKSESLNENVFEVLDKMEALQNERARKWAEHMDDMGAERLKLANILMETLDSIEQESGLFLIKPMYSFRGREMKQKYVGKLSRPGRPLRASPIRETVSSMAPAPTPSSHIRPLDGSRAYHKISSASTTSHPEPLRPLEGDPGGVAGASMSWVGQAPRQTWSFSSSHAKHVPADPLSLYNTPRILELDINRMLIGQNNISSRLPQPMTEDRLVNVSQNNLRSYVTVNRPVATPTNTTNSSRPRSASGTHRDSVPPTTPQHPSSAGMKKVRLSDTDMEIPRSLRHPRSPPLPPIGGTEPPQSPSGSSVRQTPPIREADTPADDKTLTRESSHLTSATISED